MNHLVLSVTHDSSLALLERYADVAVLDGPEHPLLHHPYDSVYIRSHFGSPETMPQKLENDINAIVETVRKHNPSVRFIDGVHSVEQILEHEDKWRQYLRYQEFMPFTRLLSEMGDTATGEKLIYKHRLASRGTGVTWDEPKDVVNPSDWIAQQSIAIQEEVRVYAVRGQILPIGAVRHSKSLEQETIAVRARALSLEERTFCANIAAMTDADVLGLDIVRSVDGAYYLLEVNRSPGFAAYAELSGVNVAALLYT